MNINEHYNLIWTDIINWVYRRKSKIKQDVKRRDLSKKKTNFIPFELLPDPACGSPENQIRDTIHANKTIYKYTLSGKSSIGFIKADIVINTHYFPLIYSHNSCWFLLFCFSLTPLYKDERTIYASLHSGISFTRTRNSERKALNKCALNKNNMSTTALVKISNERQNKTEI